MGKYQFKNIKDEKTKDSWHVEGQYYPATRYEPAEYPEVIIESDYSGNEIQDEKLIYSVDEKENFGDLDDILKNEFELVKDKAELEKACETLDDIEIDEVEDYDIYKCKNVVFTNNDVRYEKGSYFTLEDIENMFSYDTTKLVQDYYDEWKNKDYSDYYEDSKPVQDSKQTNDAIIKFIDQLENSLKGAASIAKQLANQIPNQQPSTNQEKSLYNGNYIHLLNGIVDNCKHDIERLEEYKKELSTAHVVIEEVLESFPLEARTKLRESDNPEQTYKELVEDLKRRYYSLPNKEDYKDNVIKMKKDLDGFYKNTFKK